MLSKFCHHSQAQTLGNAALLIAQMSVRLSLLTLGFIGHTENDNSDYHDLIIDDSSWTARIYHNDDRVVVDEYSCIPKT
jgi:hypothetical protein